MQRIQQLLILANLVFLLSIPIIMQGCQQSEAPEVTNEILLEVIKNADEKILVNIELADNLEEDFQIPLDMGHFMTPPFFSDYRNNLNSIISESDINSWNHKVENYKGGRFEIKKLSKLPVYDPKTETISNSDKELTAFEGFATFSLPFLNSTNDKALIYLEYLNTPESNSSKNSFLLILRNQNGKWDEVYRKLLVVTTS